MEQLFKRWFAEVWEQGNEAMIDELLAEDVRTHGLEGNEVKIGREAFRAYFRKLHGAFSEIKVTLEQVVTEGDRSVALCSCTVTHTGEGLPFPPKGKTASFGGLTMVRMQNGKIVEGWNYYDFVTMTEQLL